MHKSSSGPHTEVNRVEKEESTIQFSQFIDQFSLGILFFATIILLVLAIEIGFRFGARLTGKAVKMQASQVRAIMGAMLGLIAFMLAFTFSTAQSHYETRVGYIAEEARQVHNAFLNSDFIDEPFRSEARSILRNYIADRIRLEQLTDNSDWDEVLTVIDRSEKMQRDLWALGLTKQRDDNRIASNPFVGSVLGMIDIHNLRLQAELANRISLIVWTTLYLTAMLGMLVVGYQAGLTGRRSPLATVTLAISFSAVMMLITDLDRPMPSMFKMSSQALVVLAENMDEMLAEE
jgi:hypothetical protein